MELREVLTRRRMCRSFLADPVAPTVLDRVLDAGRRAPAAGNSAGTHLVVLEGPAETSRYWDVTLPAERRDGGDEHDGRESLGGCPGHGP